MAEPEERQYHPDSGAERPGDEARRTHHLHLPRASWPPTAATATLPEPRQDTFNHALIVVWFLQGKKLSGLFRNVENVVGLAGRGGTGPGPGYGQRTGYPPLFCVQLRVGGRDFLGEGATAQAAKHGAASKDSVHLDGRPINVFEVFRKWHQKYLVVYRGNMIWLQALKILKDLPVGEGGSKLDPTSQPFTPGTEYDELKSPISLAHEIALKRDLQVYFEVVRETGPPHMRTFVTKAANSDISGEVTRTGLASCFQCPMTMTFILILVPTYLFTWLQPPMFMFIDPSVSLVISLARGRATVRRSARSGRRSSCLSDSASSRLSPVLACPSNQRRLSRARRRAGTSSR